MPQKAFSRAFLCLIEIKIPTFAPLDSATLPVDQRTRADLFFIIEV